MRQSDRKLFLYRAKQGVRAACRKLENREPMSTTTNQSMRIQKIEYNKTSELELDGCVTHTLRIVCVYAAVCKQK